MSQARWGLPTFPFEPRDSPPTLTEVPDALLTRMRRGGLRTLEEPKRWLQGAVYDADLRLVVASQKLGGLLDAPMAMADPRRASAEPGARVLDGTWLYGGNWIQHFGHFFTESLTTLWPDGLDVQGLVFHGYMRKHSGKRPWQKQLLRLTEYAGLPVEIIEDEPLRAERLLVPDRSVVLNGWGYPEAHRVWRSMAASAGASASLDPDGDRVFLSRTVFNQNFRETGRGKRVRTQPERDVALDRVFADAGFQVVAPEELSVRQQVRLAAGASVLAGVSGSALHLSAFAPAGLRVVELGDRRSTTEQTPMQRIVDRLCDHQTAFVPYDVATDHLPEVLRGLGVAG